MTGQILLAWLKLLALDGELARAEPKTLLHLVLHAAARLVRGGRRRRLKIQASWPWARRGHHGLAAHRRAPASPLTSPQPSLRPRKDNPGARGTPATRPASRATVIPRR